MPEVLVKLHTFANLENAVRTADDIRNSGTVNYTDASGSTVNVTVGDVSVDNA